MNDTIQPRRPLGDHLQVSPIGFGAWGIGGRTPGETSYGDTDDAVSLAAIAQALAIGINFFDTAPAYGAGHSERLLGRALRGRRDAAVIATKVGIAAWGQPPDFSADGIRQSVLGSLERLQTDHLDLVQLHNATPALLEDQPAILATLRALQRAGCVRAIGVSTKSPAEARLAIERFGIAIVQANLNLLDQRAVTDGLLAAADRHRAAIIARTPLCFGFLSERDDATARFGDGDHRRAWPPAQIARWREGAQRMRRIVTAEEPDLGLAALRYCLSFPAVATVIPGMLTPGEVSANARAGMAGGLSAAVIAAVGQEAARFDPFAPR